MVFHNNNCFLTCWSLAVLEFARPVCAFESMRFSCLPGGWLQRSHSTVPLGEEKPEQVQREQAPRRTPLTSTLFVHVVIDSAAISKIDRKALRSTFSSIQRSG